MTEKSQKPSIRFKGFTDAWEQRKLGEIVDICSGRDYKQLQEGLIPVYGTGGYMLSVDQALSYSDDAIGIGRKGTIDKPYILKAPFWTVDTLFYAITREKTDLNFVFGIFQNVDWKKKDESTGVPSLSKTTINEIEVMTPKLAEQQQIGALFHSFDNLITLHQRKHDKLVNIKKALLENMFPENGEDTPKIRFKGFTDTWEQRKLREIGKTFTGLSGKSGDDFGHGQANFIIYMNIFKNPIANPNETEPIEIDERQNKVQYGDIFFTTSSETPDEVGMSSIWLENAGNTYLNSFCFGYRLNDIHSIDERYLAYLLRANSFRKNMILLAQGISRYNISKNKAIDIKIDLPTKTKEQTKIGALFTTLDNLIALHQCKLEKLKNIKKALLEKMFI